MVLFMIVSDDKYELPLMWEESIEELARKSGKKESTLRSAFSKQRWKPREHSIYRAVRLEGA